MPITMATRMIAKISPPMALMAVEGGRTWMTPPSSVRCVCPAEIRIPFWVKLTCAAAIALGTYLGGWRIIRTLGKGLVEIESPQGMAAEGASAAIILTSSHFGMALSTTHVATGSILGTGLGRNRDLHSFPTRRSSDLD